MSSLRIYCLSHESNCWGDKPVWGDFQASHKSSSHLYKKETQKNGVESLEKVCRAALLEKAAEVNAQLKRDGGTLILNVFFAKLP